jgi:hypothetical protein
MCFGAAGNHPHQPGVCTTAQDSTHRSAESFIVIWRHNYASMHFGKKSKTACRTNTGCKEKHRSIPKNLVYSSFGTNNHGGFLMKSIIPRTIIERRILIVRDQKVILDFHLAELYEVETKALKRAVKRNIDRFPKDFCFLLRDKEWQNLRRQFGTSSWGGIRYAPYAFTEEGVAMLSSVLHSMRAVTVHIEIMRAFVRLRKIIASHKELAKKLEALENKYDAQFQVVFDAIRKLMIPPDPPKRRIGFIEEPQKNYTNSRRCVKP